ncbi:MAG: collagenase [Sphaerochaetaceae bacterium]|nr:collagenase [Sphaerochaetaceae bacterium]
MKKLSLFVILLSLFLLCSCPTSLKQDPVIQGPPLDGNSIVVLDSNNPTTRVDKVQDKIPYVLITNFTPNENYASEELAYDTSTSNPWDTVRSNNIYPYSLSTGTPRSVIRASVNSSTKATLSSPQMDESGKVVWNNFIYDDGQYIKNYKELYTDANNKIIYLLDSDKYSVTADSPAMELIKYMYENPDSAAKMDSNLLVKLQNQVAKPNESFPNKNYLFNKSDTDTGYFLVLMDRFDKRGWQSSVGGYFSSDIYTGESNNTPYAAFHLNTYSSFTGYWDYAAEKHANIWDYYGVADNFISTLAHEYTHYLESDYKYTQKFNNKNSIHFLSEGYANYIAGKGTGDTTFGGGKLGNYMSELLGGHKIYEPKDSDDTSYGLGHLFFAYIEEKYGAAIPSQIMTNDNALLHNVENVTGKKFRDIYEDFILNLIFSGYTGSKTIEGKEYGHMTFANYTQWNSNIGKYEDVHGFETIFAEFSRYIKDNKGEAKDFVTKENIYEDVKMILEGNEGVSSEIGEMSFRLVCYPNGAPNGITLTSDSPYIKAYLFYSDKKPNE